MPPKLKDFLLRWINTAIGVLVATYLVKGIHYQHPLDLAMAALLLGMLNAVVRVTRLLAIFLPLVILTFGIFILVLNGLLLYLVGALMYPHFEVASFWAAFWGALVITIVSLFLNGLTGSGSARLTVRRGRPPQNPPSDTPPGQGPVIDV